MSAATSRAGSARATPQLSPTMTATAWSTDAGPSSWGHRMRPSLSHDTTPRDAHAHPDQWWENVLPPGQLAERLRRAQTPLSHSSSSSSSAAAAAAKQYRVRSTLANATPTERKAWRRLSDLGQDWTPPTSISSGSTTSSNTSVGSSRRSSTRSSTSSSNTSVGSSPFSPSSMCTENSSDECNTSSGQQSPLNRSGHFSHFEAFDEHEVNYSTFKASDQMGINWPGLGNSSMPKTYSRSSSNRRTRVMSEDGLGLGINSAASSRRSSVNGLASHNHNLRHFPQGGYSSSHRGDSPETSSDDSSEGRSSTTTTTRRHSRTVSMTTATLRSSNIGGAGTTPQILQSHFDHPELGHSTLHTQSPGSRGRHISFDGDADAALKAARSRHRVSMPASGLQESASSGHFDSFPSRSSTSRRSRHGFRHLDDHRRTSSFSAPGSRRGSIHIDRASVDSARHRRTSSIPDVALLSSLNVAQNQLATAGNLAVTLTRQLSAPLRPVFHLALFLSISSVTLASLLCFLTASYMLTAWDDVSKRSHRVTAVAGSARKSVEATVTWGFKMLAPPKRPSKPSSLPPRPPLSLLIPSILFTAMIAIGTGLATLLANRRAAEQRRPSSPRTSPRATPAY